MYEVCGMDIACFVQYLIHLQDRILLFLKSMQVVAIYGACVLHTRSRSRLD
jgi:hypothetical protein